MNFLEILILIQSQTCFKYSVATRGLCLLYGTAQIQNITTESSGGLTIMSWLLSCYFSHFLWQVYVWHFVYQVNIVFSLQHKLNYFTLFFRIACRSKSIEVRLIFLSGLCIAVAVVWAVFRNEDRYGYSV
jgi:hypothetical protein